MLHQVRGDLAGRRGVPQVAVVDLARDTVIAEHFIRPEGLDVAVALADGHVGVVAALQLDHARELPTAVLDGGVQLVDRDGPGRGRSARAVRRCRRCLVDTRTRAGTGAGTAAGSGRRGRLDERNRVHAECDLLLLTGDGARRCIAQRSDVPLEVLGDVLASARTQRAGENHYADSYHSMSQRHVFCSSTGALVMYRQII